MQVCSQTGMVLLKFKKLMNISSFKELDDGYTLYSVILGKDRPENCENIINNAARVKPSLIVIMDDDVLTKNLLMYDKKCRMSYIVSTLYDMGYTAILSGHDYIGLVNTDIIDVEASLLGSTNAYFMFDDKSSNQLSDDADEDKTESSLHQHLTSHVHIDVDFNKIEVLSDVERQIIINGIMKINQELKKYYNNDSVMSEFNFKIVNENNYNVD
jgi:hypothetical protein